MQSPTETAKNHIWLGEVALAQDEEPETAIAHFEKALALTPIKDRIHALAAYDRAMAFFYEGAYRHSLDAFKNVLSPKNHLTGFDRRTCALWLRHASACAGYHEERAKIGIVEPTRIDPLCAAAALATCLRSLNADYSKKTVLANIRHNGEGSNMNDVIDAGHKMGMQAHPVTSDDNGLISLPKPLIAYVEHDHFVALVRANKKGVSYLCSDCGPWPGGRINLSWNQWHKMEATAYVAITPKDSILDNTLTHIAQNMPNQANGVQLASVGNLPKMQSVLQQVTLISALKGHVLQYLPLNPPSCGYKPDSTRGNGNSCGSTDSSGGMGPSMAAGASAGDPVNLATGEEEYTPAPDLNVYNPIGPSVSWGRVYNSLRNYYNGFGTSWAQSYDIKVFADMFDGHPISITYPNGSTMAVTCPTFPTAANPKTTCIVASGTPYLVEMNYRTISFSPYYAYYLTITFPDRTKWVSQQWYVIHYHQNFTAPIEQIIDRNGNAISFAYAGLNLNAINDKNGSALLTINRDSNSNITSITDRYSRSVYYHIGTYTGFNSYYELDQASQIVATGTSSPPDRYAYGYQNILN